MSGDPTSDVIVRRSGQGWQVGDEHASDLTSAMVLADLLTAEGSGGLGGVVPPGASRAADLEAPGPGGPRGSAPGAGQNEAARLAVTVAQLEHALAARVRIEQAIGVLAERHRLRPRQAFELLRGVARSSGQRVIHIAEAVVDSASNALLQLPEELARKPVTVRVRGRSPRHARRAS